MFSNRKGVLGGGSCLLSPRASRRSRVSRKVGSGRRGSALSVFQFLSLALNHPWTNAYVFLRKAKVGWVRMGEGYLGTSYSDW